MEIRDVRQLMIDVWQVGYMEAVKAYEPARDEIRKSEIGDWLRVVGIDRGTFGKLEKAGLIHSRKMGRGGNSPLVYSKLEIKRAVATKTASVLQSDEELRKIEHSANFHKERGVAGMRHVGAPM